MRVKRHLTIGILLTIVTLQTTIDCVEKDKIGPIASKIKGTSNTIKDKLNKGGSALKNRITNVSGKRKNGNSSQTKETSNDIMNAVNMNENTYKNWKTSSIARNFNKVIGFAPVLKENDVQKLLYLAVHEADLIKIGALKKLINLTKGASTEDVKKQLALAKIRAATEVVKYYGVVNNCPKVKYTFGQGLYYSHTCVKLHGSNPGECLKRKAQLIEAFLLSHGLETHRGMRNWISMVSKKASKHLKDDKVLKFIDTRITCEIKLMQEDKNVFLKSLMKLYAGGTKKDKNYDCVKELLQFQNIIDEVGSSNGEYYYLLGKAYAHKGNLSSALSCLENARESKVFDQKSRYVNKKVQEYYEKIYTRVKANKTK